METTCNSVGKARDSSTVSTEASGLGFPSQCWPSLGSVMSRLRQQQKSQNQGPPHSFLVNLSSPQSRTLPSRGVRFGHLSRLLRPTRALLLSINQESSVAGTCPILGTGDGEKVAGEEMTDQLLLAPVQQARTERGIEQSRSPSPSIAGILADPHFRWCCMCGTGSSMVSFDFFFFFLNQAWPPLSTQLGRTRPNVQKSPT